MILNLGDPFDEVRKIVKYSKEQYLEINEDRISFVKSKKEQYLEKIKDLEKIKEEI